MSTRIGGTEILEGQANFPKCSTQLYVEDDRIKAELLLTNRNDTKKAAAICAGCLLNVTDRRCRGRLVECSGTTADNWIAKISFGIGDLEETEPNQFAKLKNQVADLSSCGLPGLRNALTAVEG